MLILGKKAPDVTDLASSFLGGQGQIDTKNNEVYRGEIEHIAAQGNTVYIFFVWLVVRTTTKDEPSKSKLLWRIVPPSRSGEIRIDFPFQKYLYLEKDAQVVLTGWGERCCFSKQGDATNIAKPE